MPINPQLGVAFSGDLAISPWASGLTTGGLATAVDAGMDLASIPLSPGAALTSTLTSAPAPAAANLAGLVGDVSAGGLLPWVVPHNDGTTDDAIRLQWFLDPAAYLAWFTQIAQALKGLPAILELWNEADYTAADAATYGLTWDSMTALYTGLAPQLATVARANGLRFALPLPLDQSPESTLGLQQSGAFPWQAMAAIEAEFVTAHVYDIESGPYPSPLCRMRFTQRLDVVVDTAVALGATPLISECNPLIGADQAYSLQRVTDWEEEFCQRQLGRIYWEAHSAPALTSDVLTPSFLAALHSANGLGVTPALSTSVKN